MALIVDSDTLNLVATEDPLVFIATCSVTSDEKSFTPVQFRYNSNMKKEEILGAIARENSVAAAKNTETPKAICLLTLDKSAKQFPKISAVPVDEPIEEG